MFKISQYSLVQGYSSLIEKLIIQFLQRSSIKGIMRNMTIAWKISVAL